MNEDSPKESRPQIALTFDDGPSEVTMRVLDALEKAGAKATFFVQGIMVARRKRELQRMVQGGFQIGNHTWDHEYISKIPEEELRRVISKTNDAIRDACGVVPEVMRPPGGVWSDAALAVLGEMGLSMVFWDVDPRDWETRDAQMTIDYVLDKAEDGNIVIMHDLYEPTADAAEVIIPELVARGFELLTVSELARNRGGMLPGKQYSGF